MRLTPSCCTAAVALEMYCWKYDSLNWSHRTSERGLSYSPARAKGQSRAAQQ